MAGAAAGIVRQPAFQPGLALLGPVPPFATTTSCVVDSDYPTFPLWSQVRLAVGQPGGDADGSRSDAGILRSHADAVLPPGSTREALLEQRDPHRSVPGYPKPHHVGGLILAGLPSIDLAT